MAVDTQSQQDEGSTALHDGYFQAKWLLSNTDALTCVRVGWLSIPRRRCMNSLTAVWVLLDSPDSNTKTAS